MEKRVFIARRDRLLASMADNSVAVIPSAREQVRSRDTHFAFRQDSDFFYLTGYAEPDALLVLRKQDNKHTATLFNRPKDPLMEIWEGRRLGQDAAMDALEVDQAFDIAEVDSQLHLLLNGAETLYFAQGAYPEVDTQVSSALAKLRGGPKKGWLAPNTQVDLRSVVHEMRLRKDEAELKAMRFAALVSAQAHTRAMEKSRPGMWEYQLEAEIHHEFARQGCRHPAYASIVGGGANACILHYTENDAQLKDGDLVLIDAGGEFNHYAADITRTFPVNGKFTPEQRALYDIVLRAELAACDEIKPGGTIAAAGKAAVRVLVSGLVELGILSGDIDKLIKDEAYKPFYMHGIGHWLGIDVHDVGLYKQQGEERALEPGMVLTIEPGLYIQADDENVEPRWRGIGVRIEDNLLVTEQGHDNLTESVVKEADAIEALMAQAQQSRQALGA